MYGSTRKMKFSLYAFFQTRKKLDLPRNLFPKTRDYRVTAVQTNRKIFREVMGLTEATALLRLQHGSQEALSWFIDKYTPYVCTVIRYIIGGSMTEADVEEAASDVFLVLWQHPERVSLATLRPWLGGVARNKARQKLRERNMTLSLEEDLLIVDEADPERSLEREDRDRTVRAAVLAMEPTDREIFLRYYYHCQPVAVIARELGSPASTVKSRLRRGREKLRAALEGKVKVETIMNGNQAYRITELLDCLEDAGQELKPRGGSAARVRALTLSRLRGEAPKSQRVRKRIRPLTAAAAALAAVFLLGGSVFAAWKLGVFRFGDYFGPQGRVFDDYAQSYEPDPSKSVPVKSAEGLQTPEEFEAYSQPFLVTSVETADYRFSLRTLTATPSMLYAVMDVEGISEFGKEHLDTAPELALHNSTHHAGGTLLDARLVGEEENLRRWLFGISTTQPINEVGDLISFEALDLLTAEGWTNHGTRFFDVCLEKVMPEALTLTEPRGEAEGGCRWESLRLDLAGMTLEAPLAGNKPSYPTVVLVFRDGTRETVLYEGWQGGAPRRSPHEAFLADMSGSYETLWVNLVFGAPLDLNTLEEIVVDGLRFRLNDGSQAPGE